MNETRRETINLGQEFEIIGSDDHLFCKMQKTGEDIILMTANCSITLTNLAKQVSNPGDKRRKKMKSRKDEIKTDKNKKYEGVTAQGNNTA